jgi:hypothetical protein
VEFREIKWRANSEGASGVCTPLIFCHIDDNDKQALEWGGCVGWLWDSYQSHVEKHNCYYPYDYASNPYSDTKTYIGVAKGQTRSTHVRAQQLINLFEKQAGLGLTRVYHTQTRGMYAYEGPKDWTDSPFMISLYTFLMRCAFLKAPATSVAEFNNWAKINPVESWQFKEYVSNTWKHIPKVLENRGMLKWKKFPYPKGSLHGMGISFLLSTETGYYSKPEVNDAINKFRAVVKGEA